MTKNKTYRLEIDLSDGANVENIEDYLEQVLLDLYNQDGIENVRVVRDGYTQDNEIVKMLDVIDRIDMDNIHRSAALIRLLEEVSNE